MQKKGFKLVSVIALVNALFVIKANASFPLPPRFSANAYASDYTVGQADLMLPLAGNRSHNFYVNPNVAASTDDEGYANVGVGYRWIQKEAAILGWYVFGGYTRIDNNARLWVANPGVEAFGSRWDAHLNGYIAMGDRNDNLGDNFTFNHFAGHAQFDNDLQTVQHAGDGADIKVGYQLFPRLPLKGYVGSYYFAPTQSNNIWGGAAGLEYWLDSYIKVFASYTYDTRRRSTGAIGLGIELGGTHKHRSDPAVEERITDPVEHYLAELGRSDEIPNRITTQLISVNIMEANNIAFFSQTGGPNNGGIGLTAANCTFEHPCGPTDLTNAGAAQLASLLPNTMMYFNGGSYNALNVPGGTSGVTLQAGQSVQSRSTDYSQPATGPARSTFNGAFRLSGNNTLDNIILLSTPATSSLSGVLANTGSNNSILNSDIGSVANPFDTGISLVGTNNNLISGTTVFSIFTGAFVSNASASIQNSKINVNAPLAPGFVGLLASSGSSVDITNSTITAAAALGSGTGITSQSGSTVNANDNTKVTVTTGATFQAIALNNENTTGSTLQMSNGVLIVAGSAASAIANPGGGAQITSSTCTLNGVQVVCP
jgi:Inverse autotransporter, beta-domain